MEKKFYLSLKMRLILLMFVIVIPLTFMVTGYQRMFEKYSRSYNEIMANLKVANDQRNICRVLQKSDSCGRRHDWRRFNICNL